MQNQNKLELDQDTIDHLLHLFQNQISSFNHQPIQTILNLDHQLFRTISSSQIPQFKYVYNQIKTRDSICIQLIQKALDVFSILKSWRNDHQKEKLVIQKKIQALQLDYVSKCEKLNDLEVSIFDIQQQIQRYENINEEQRRKNEQIQEKMQQNYKRFMQQRQLSAKKQKNNELRQEQQIQNLRIYNENLCKLLSQSQLQCKRKIQVIQQKQKQIKQLQEQIKQLGSKLQYQIKRNSDLFKIVQQKQHKIQFQFVPYQSSIRKYSDQYSHSEKYRSEFKLQKHNLKQQLNTSTIQANINIFNYMNNVIGKSQSNFEQKKQIQYQQYQNKRIYIDPYYAHFVLTSQSVKIKQDKQQYLNIDMKPCYSEIIQKRIPMHLWDQWIKNKLKQESSRIQFFQIE